VHGGGGGERKCEAEAGPDSSKQALGASGGKLQRGGNGESKESREMREGRRSV
jgi:hypothetical protein